MGNGTFCEDLDECLFDIHNCGENSFCVNSNGAFECECNPGFEFDLNGTCIDVNECLAPDTSVHKCSYDPEGKI